MLDLHRRSDARLVRKTRVAGSGAADSVRRDTMCSRVRQEASASSALVGGAPSPSDESILSDERGGARLISRRATGRASAACAVQYTAPAAPRVSAAR